MENADFITLLSELDRQKVDLSDLIAQIDVSCMQLEILEPGQWYDVPQRRRRIESTDVASWLARYGFKNLGDLPQPALIAFSISLQRQLQRIDPNTIKAPAIAEAGSGAVQ